MREGSKVLQVYPPQLHPLLELASRISVTSLQSLLLCKKTSSPHQPLLTFLGLLGGGMGEGRGQGPGSDEVKFGEEPDVGLPGSEEGQDAVCWCLSCWPWSCLYAPLPQSSTHISLDNNNPIRKLHGQQ